MIKTVSRLTIGSQFFIWFIVIDLCSTVWLQRFRQEYGSPGLLYGNWRIGGGIAG